MDGPGGVPGATGTEAITCGPPRRGGGDVVRGEGGAVDPCRRQVVVIDPSRAWAEALAKVASTALDVEARWGAPSDGELSELVDGASVVVLGDGDGTDALR